MKRNRKIAFLGIGIALYVVVSILVRIPLVNRIKLDMGYIVFALFLSEFGISGTVVGVAGCVIANMLSGGSLPVAWALAQALIGIVMGLYFAREKNTLKRCLLAIPVMFIALSGLKTILEVWMFQLPLYAKFLSNSVAFIADLIPFCIGTVLSSRLRIPQKH